MSGYGCRVKPDQLFVAVLPPQKILLKPYTGLFMAVPIVNWMEQFH
jgi:hypothetical protein